nr:hypothetical protein [Herbaspirillum sp. B39]
MSKMSKSRKRHRVTDGVFHVRCKGHTLHADTYPQTLGCIESHTPNQKQKRHRRTGGVSFAALLAG